MHINQVKTCASWLLPQKTTLRNIATKTHRVFMTDLTMRELANITGMKHLADWQIIKKQTAKTIFIEFCKMKKVKPILDTLIIGFSHSDGTSIELKLDSYRDAEYVNGILQASCYLSNLELLEDCQVIEVDFKKKEIIK